MKERKEEYKRKNKERERERERELVFFTVPVKIEELENSEEKNSA